jgi:hypothetical protein
MSGIARYTSSVERRMLRSPGRPDHRWGMTEEQALTARLYRYTSVLTSDVFMEAMFYVDNTNWV